MIHDFGRKDHLGRAAIVRLIESLNRAPDSRTEWVLPASVANRALAPRSKLAATKWIAERVAITGFGEIDGD